MGYPAPAAGLDVMSPIKQAEAESSMQIKAIVGILASFFIGGSVFAQSSHDPAPQIDGVIGVTEWSGARHEALVGDGELLLLRKNNYLYVAVIGADSGLVSLCTGDLERVEILHASAALGSVSYTRTNSQWLRGEPFEWHLRDVSESSKPLSVKRESFFEEHHWLANSSRVQTPKREFKIKLGRHRQFLSVVFLLLDNMKVAYWPASTNGDCRNLRLLRGWAPDSLKFEPSTWHKIKQLRKSE